MLKLQNIENFKLNIVSLNYYYEYEMKFSGELIDERL